MAPLRPVLSEHDRLIRRQGQIDRLKQIHDDLDAAVFDAYGWPDTLSDEQILEKLVALNHQRAEEEKLGVIRWLRPEFQKPRIQSMFPPKEIAKVAPEHESSEARVDVEWPKEIANRVTAILTVIRNAKSPPTLPDIRKRLKGSQPKHIAELVQSMLSCAILREKDNTYVAT